MPRELHLDLTQPDGRIVRVDVRVLPLVGVRRHMLPDEAGEGPVHPIDDDQLTDKATLHAFLARITRSQANGAVVHAACFDPDADRMLEVLGISGPPPAVIRIKVPAA